MKDLSIGVNISWQIAAQEAVAANLQFIEKEHIFIGMCSLDKVLILSQEKTGLKPEDRKALEFEHYALEYLFRGFELNLTQIRRHLRKRLGKGNYKKTEKVVHRSDACKKIFNLASELPAPASVITCLHLLVAILEEPGKIVSRVLNDAGVESKDLMERALATAIKEKV